MRCPVKIIWGKDDPWIPLERGEALHALIPQASFETLPGAGHLPQLEAPDLVLERLNAFLSRTS
ncbi:alpha/beta fold hydrolase [Mesorhizobium ventifaucium]|uniref:alpha/beta fold hydrolase n=1 Tax=Mesorhizobium ventifaucium TaxID=666020 RepID=UPI00345BEDFB